MILSIEDIFTNRKHRGKSARPSICTRGRAKITDFFPGFAPRRIATSGAEIKLAPRFAAEFTAVVPDLRGYGDSAKPPAGSDNAGRSKRALALDQIETTAALGFELCRRRP